MGSTGLINRSGGPELDRSEPCMLEGYFEVDSTFDREPVKRNEYRRNVFIFFGLISFSDSL